MGDVRYLETVREWNSSIYRLIRRDVQLAPAEEKGRRMILRILSFLFPQVRGLTGRITSANVAAAKLGNECSELRSKIRDLEAKLDKSSAQASHWNARYDAAAEAVTYGRKQTEKAEDRANEANRELTDILKTAGDSLGLRVTGRRLFSKAPVEAPPDSQEPRTPINVSQGAGWQFAGDVVRRHNAEFFKSRAQQAGVVPKEGEQKPN